MPFSEQLPANKIDYILSIVSREVKGEDRLPKQLLYVGFSAYTSNPINLAISAPSGEGKNFSIKHVLSLFPPQDVMFLTHMTEKALFHESGKIVADTGNDGPDRYKDIDEQVQTLKEHINFLKHEQRKIQGKSSKDYQDLSEEIQHDTDELRALTKEAKKLIDLNNKILVLLDTPSRNLFAALMSLLSHDSYYQEYKYADTSSGIRTLTNVLAGYPAVVYAAAIDYSEWKRYGEVQRRFVITNPKMTVAKYQEAALLSGQRHGLPSLLYEKQVVSDTEKTLAKDCIKYLKEQQIQTVSKSSETKHAMAFIPFYQRIATAFEMKKGTDMTMVDRLFTFLELLPVINYEHRPRVRIGKKVYPIALFQDLQETLKLMEYSDGVRPFIVEWFNEVFLELYHLKTEPDTKIVSRGKEEQTVSEDIIAVTSRELVEKTKAVQSKSFTTKQILERYLTPLSNEGYIDEQDSKLDRRQKIYFPVIQKKVNKLIEKTETTNFSQQCQIMINNSNITEDLELLKFEIWKQLRYSSEKNDLHDILFDHTGKSISLGKLFTYYQPRPQNASSIFSMQAIGELNTEDRSEGDSSAEM